MKISVESPELSAKEPKGQMDLAFFAAGSFLLGAELEADVLAGGLVLPGKLLKLFYFGLVLL